MASLSARLANCCGLRIHSISLSDKDTVGKGQLVTNEETSLIAEQLYQTASSPMQLLFVKVSAQV